MEVPLFAFFKWFSNLVYHLKQDNFCQDFLNFKVRFLCLNVPFYRFVPSVSKVLPFVDLLKGKLPLDQIDVLLVYLYLLRVFMFYEISIEQLDVFNFVNFARQLDVSRNMVYRTIIFVSER